MGDVRLLGSSLPHYPTPALHDRRWVGAGIGSFGAWLRIDLAPRASVLAAMAMALILAGIGGAWGGFQFGGTREVACCVGPAIGPITYTVLGATIAANAAALTMVLIHGIGHRRDWRRFRAGGPGSTAGASGGVGGP